MLNKRLTAAHSVRDSFLPLKQEIDRLAMQAGKCVTTLHIARESSGMPLGTGSDAIADIARGAALLYEAERCFAVAHPKLASLIEDAGLGRFYAYGDDECPPDSQFSRPLGTVRAA